MFIHVNPIFLIQRSKLNVDCSMFISPKVAADVPAAALDPGQAHAFAEDVERHLEYGSVHLTAIIENEKK